MEDVKPLATNLPLTMTWYRESSNFSPGRLDYIVYSGSVLSLANSYSLFTPALSASELAANNLQSNDAIIASDHLPLVADFDFGGSTAIDSEDATLKLRISPNPINGPATLAYSLSQSSPVEINIFDAAGKKVFSQHIESSGLGDFKLALDTQAFAAGIYYCQLLTDFGRSTVKFRVDQQ
ncbi:MAG: T9SS type A sorting domain-containing protein [Bacteroidota bacterium]